MVQKFSVRLSVDLSVHAGDPMEAKSVAKDWLQQVLRSADTSGQYRPLISTTEQTEESVFLSDAEEVEQAENRQAREAGGNERVELLRQLASAHTTEEYVAAGESVDAWLKAHKEPYHTALSEINYYLATFSEAIRWTSQNPNGPAIWNVGRLIIDIKRLVQKELDASL